MTNIIYLPLPDHLMDFDLVKTINNNKTVRYLEATDLIVKEVVSVSTNPRQKCLDFSSSLQWPTAN